MAWGSPEVWATANPAQPASNPTSVARISNNLAMGVRPYQRQGNERVTGIMHELVDVWPAMSDVAPPGACWNRWRSSGG